MSSFRNGDTNEEQVALELGEGILIGGMTDDDDELTRRFRELFNKEPVSGTSPTGGESRWSVPDVGDYDVDDEEVSFMETMGDNGSWEN